MNEINVPDQNKRMLGELIRIVYETHFELFISTIPDLKQIANGASPEINAALLHIISFLEPIQEKLNNIVQRYDLEHLINEADGCYEPVED